MVFHSDICQYFLICVIQQAYTCTWTVKTRVEAAIVYKWHPQLSGIDFGKQNTKKALLLKKAGRICSNINKLINYQIPFKSVSLIDLIWPTNAHENENDHGIWMKIKQSRMMQNNSFICNHTTWKS